MACLGIYLVQEEEEIAPATARADSVNTHCVSTETELRAPDPLLWSTLTEADYCILMLVISNTIHWNDGMHLDAGITNNHR